MIVENIPLPITIDDGSLVAMILEPVESQGWLRLMGRDRDGTIRRGEIGMADFHLLPTPEMRLARMQEVTRTVAAHPPYFTQVEEIHFWKKRVVDLSQRGLSATHEAIVINGANYIEQMQGTLVFPILERNQETATFGLTGTPEIDQEEIASGIFDHFLEFVITYKKSDPTRKKSKRN
jgi:hypothetical protein